jgi:DNA-binding transcriptional ArsR family regulator
VSAEVDQTLAALADPARRAIVELVRQRPQRPSEVAAALGVTRPALSRHLGVLRRAGLISERIADDDARAHILELRPERLAGLRTWLDEVEGFWTEQLAAFKAHAERGPAPRPRAPARRRRS